MKNQFVISHDSKGRRHKIKKDELNFRPSVYGLVFKHNKILLSKVWDGYDFPGGGVNKGELIEDALKREVWEETGLKVKPYRLITVTEDFFISIPSKRKLHSILIYYICVNPKGKISTKNLTEIEKKYLGTGEAKWVELRDIKNLKFYNGVNSVELIQMALKLRV
ncbi:MAG TPA: NUDIX hydrolase [Candidatus Limnocylindria bacterium]|nr:NUDIX hydrolase [Candidatus Limnocylindria bacterium]